MNEKIKQLTEQAGFKLIDIRDQFDYNEDSPIKKFAELIVRECVEQGKQIQSQSVSNGSEEYNTGREMGIEVFMNQIKKHFGVE